MRQTPRSYVAVMEGCAKAIETQKNLVVLGAWHGEAFHRTKRLKALAEYLGIRDQQRGDARSVLAMFRGLQSKAGFDVKITPAKGRERAP